MSKVKLDIGAVVDFVSPDELQQALAEHRQRADAAEQEYIKGLKYIRLPRLYATPSSGTVVLGQAWSGNSAYTDQVISPNSGYVWSVRRLLVTGLGTGQTPDVINFYRNDITGPVLWQLNGNSFGQTFGKTEMILLPGDKLVAQSVGSMTSTLMVTITGDAVACPVVMIGKLVA